MLFKLTPISMAIFIAAAVNVFIVYHSWHRRNAKSGVYFALAMVAITFWTLAAALDYSAIPISLKVFFAKLEYLGYASAIALLAAFALSYAGYEDWLKKTWVKALLIGIPVLVVLLAWTNEWHSLIWAGFVANTAVDNVVIFEHGPAFVWIALLGYALILVIFASLLTVALHGTEIARKQARLLLGALLMLVASNLLYLSDIFHTPGVDWSSVTFSITGLLFLFALYGTRFMDVIPVARNTMIERMTDGVFVLDIRGNLVDYNPAAQAIFNIGKADLWTPCQAALARWPTIIALLENPAKPAAKDIAIGNPARIFELLLTPLEDNRSQAYGLLVVMRDVTERRRIRASLTDSNQRYDELVARIPVGVFRLRKSPSDEARFEYFSPRAYEIFGIDQQAVLDNVGISLLTTGTQDDDEFNQAVDRALNTPEDFHGVRTDVVQGQTVWTDIHAKHTVLENGDVVWDGVIEDITERKRAEAELRVLSRAIEHSQVALMITDTTGTIEYVNPKFTEMTGYDLAEVRGRNPRLLRSGGATPEVYHDLWTTILTGHDWRGEFHNQKKDGELYWDATIISPIVDEHGTITHFVAVKEDVTERKQAAEALLKMAAFEERQRMARDLHDSVNQSIHSLVLFSETLAATLDNQQFERARQIAERLQESARQALKETRLLLYQIRSPLVASGAELLQNLEVRLATVEQRTGMKAEITQEGSLEFCPPAWAENLFAIAIEALNNALKHAQARTVRINLCCFPHRVDLEIVDDGRGFDPTKLHTGGMGLSNLYKRAELIGGQLDIVSAPGQGCRVQFCAEIKEEL